MSHLVECDGRAAAGYPSQRVPQNTEETPASRHSYQMNSDIFENETDPHSQEILSHHLNKEGISFSNIECSNRRDESLISRKPAAGYSSSQIENDMMLSSVLRPHREMAYDILGVRSANPWSFTTIGLDSTENLPENPVPLQQTTDIEKLAAAVTEAGESLDEQAFKPGKRHFEGKHDNQKLW